MFDLLKTNSWDVCLDRTIDSDGIPTLGCVWVAVQNVINVFSVLAGLFALLLIIYSGVKFITSRGDKEKVDSARKTFVFAIIGLVFIILASLIIKFISDLTGISYDRLVTPPGN